jgi:hypothetical protein
MQATRVCATKRKRALKRQERLGAPKIKTLASTTNDSGEKKQRQDRKDMKGARMTT